MKTYARKHPRKHASEKAAKKAIWAANQNGRLAGFVAYKCAECGAWHVKSGRWR